MCVYVYGYRTRRSLYTHTHTRACCCSYLEISFLDIYTWAAHTCALARNAAGPDVDYIATLCCALATHTHTAARLNCPSCQLAHPPGNWQIVADWLSKRNGDFPWYILVAVRRASFYVWCPLRREWVFSDSEILRGNLSGKGGWMHVQVYRRTRRWCILLEVARTWVFWWFVSACFAGYVCRGAGYNECTGLIARGLVY